MLFFCDTGYELSGVQVLECTDDDTPDNGIGVWDNSGPTCEDADECADGSNDCDPNASCTNEIGSFTCTCKEGFTGNGTFCTAVTCDIPTINFGEITCTGAEGSYGETCIVACDDGYIGDTSVTCGNDGNWDKVPSCNAITCSIPPIEAGEITCNSAEGVVNETCKVTCDDGYTGDTSVTCGNDGNWDKTPSCNDIDECSESADNCDANASCTNDIGSFTCTCKEGFAGNGTSCTAITCPSLSTPQNGNPPSCTDDENYGSVCTFTCMTGYAIVGVSTLTCAGDGSSEIGSYDNPPPTCETIRCEDLSLPINGDKTCTDENNYGTVTCPIPKIDFGNITCIAAEEGSYNEICTVTCNDGYIGDSSVTCGTDGDWDKVPFMY